MNSSVAERLLGVRHLKRTQHKMRKFLVPANAVALSFTNVNWWFMRFRKCASNSFTGIASRQIDRGERISIAGTLQAFFACTYRRSQEMDELHTKMFAQISILHRLWFAIIEGIQINQGPNYCLLRPRCVERIANKFSNLIKCKIHNFTFSPSMQSRSRWFLIPFIKGYTGASEILFVNRKFVAYMMHASKIMCRFTFMLATRHRAHTHTRPEPHVAGNKIKYAPYLVFIWRIDLTWCCFTLALASASRRVFHSSPKRACSIVSGHSVCGKRIDVAFMLRFQ